MMRFKEAQTRFFPDPLPIDSESKNKLPSMNNEGLFHLKKILNVKNLLKGPYPHVACEFSVRKKAFVCLPISEAPW